MQSKIAHWAGLPDRADGSMTRNRATPRCFISHKTGDPALDACLIRPLPKKATHVVFERIDETSEVGVVSPLMDAIRDCDMLAYLDTPVSLGSPWVGMERTYAARIGKPVFAFRPDHGLLAPAFTQDFSPPLDPVVSLLVNLEIADDVRRLQAAMTFARERDKVEFLGLTKRPVNSDPRHMLDSIDGMQTKLAHGAIALLFLSTESIESDFHDYADTLAVHRARRDFDTPTGRTSERFAALPPDRTLVCWLGSPDAERIHRALERFDPQVWANYVTVVRNALLAPRPCVLFGPDGVLDRMQIDYMIVRAYLEAHQVDPVLAADFRAELRGQKKRPTAERPDLAARMTDRGWPRPGIV